MADSRQPAVYALYPGRRRDRIYEFVEEFAGPTALTRPLPHGTVRLVDARGERTRSARARTIREAIELGLLNDGWAFAVVIGAPAGSEVVVAYAADGNSVLGVRVPAERVDEPDDVLPGLERTMRVMMTAFPAEICVMGLELELRWTAEGWARLVRTLADDPDHDLPWFVRGEWFTKSRVRADAAATAQDLEQLDQAFRSRGLQVRVDASYPVRREPTAPWTLLVETPLHQFLGRVDPARDGTGLAGLLGEIAAIHDGMARSADPDADPVRGKLLRGPASTPPGRVILHDIGTDTQWVIPGDAEASLLASLEPGDGRGGVRRPTESHEGWMDA